MSKMAKVLSDINILPKKKSQTKKDSEADEKKKQSLNATLSNDIILTEKAVFSSEKTSLESVEKKRSLTKKESENEEKRRQLSTDLILFSNSKLEKSSLKRESPVPIEGEIPYKKLKVSSDEYTPINDTIKADNTPVNEMDYIAPWITPSTMKIKNSLVRLHNEIIDFYNYILPSEEEHSSRLDAIKKLEDVILDAYPEAQILPFGSFKTKLYLPNADIDLVILHESKSSNWLLSKVANILLKREDLYERVNIIKSAKVPIVKLVEKEHSYNFDISFNKFDGIKQLKEAEKAFDIYPEMKFLIIIAKCILRQRDLHETYTGGIGSFLLFCMVLAFLREVRKDYFKSNRLNELQNMMLSEYLLKFLEFYGIKFDLNLHQIIMQDGGSIVQKNQQNAEYGFSLISPQDSTHDIGNASFRIKEIFNVFKNRFNFLTNYNFEEGESILKYLINPSKNVFTYLKEKKN